jgi:Cupin-like domain
VHPTQDLTRTAVAPEPGPADARPSPILDGWRRWAAEATLEGVPSEAILRIMVDAGIPEESARAELAAMTSHPWFEPGRWMAQRLRKLESVLDVRLQLESLAPGIAAVPRRPTCSRRRFLEEHYAANRPLVLTGFAGRWRATSLWTPEYLREKAGEERVEVMAGREGDERYEVNADAHKTMMRMADYVDAVVRRGSSNDLYLVANNHFLERPAAAALWGDFEVDRRYLDPAAARGSVFLWFGPGGTVTPLHHDLLNILFVQVVGRKRITMISPLQGHRVYNDVGVYSEVDPDRPDEHRHPRFRDVRAAEVVLEPGDALFIPVGWWHRVEALDLSFSLSFTNFVFPNSYHWELPSIVR